MIGYANYTSIVFTQKDADKNWPRKIDKAIKGINE
jgi:hypothetical protein